MPTPSPKRALVGALAVALALAFFLAALPTAPARAQPPNIGTSTGMVVRGTTLTTDVRALSPIPPKPLARPPLVQPRPASGGTTVAVSAPAPAVAAMPTPSLTFDGLSFNGTCGTVPCGAGWPPDPNGDVSPSFYVQTVNTAIGIFDKSGTPLAAVTFDTLWSTANSGTPCDNNNQGDPTAVYDPTTGLWTIADFAFAVSGPNPNPPFYECLAIVPDSSLVPVGPGWKLFAVETDQPTPGTTGAAFPDYPKMAAWPDGLHMSANMFNAAGTSFLEARLWAFDIAEGFATGSLKLVMTDTNSTEFSLLSSNDRSSPPLAGSPNYVVAEDQNSVDLDVFKYQVDFTNPINTTLTGPVLVSHQGYTQPQTSRTTDIVPQPSTSQKLDSLGNRLMVQAQYQDLGGVESLWVAHTVGLGSSISNPGPTGIQWVQINVTGGVIAPVPVQQQIWSNGSDGNYRWVPSLAVDQLGNVALGYSVSNATANHFPSIRYAGRLVTDLPNNLAQGETAFFTGAGAQKTIDRWGDYTLMTLDPDGCTFWYVDEYYAASGSDWHTRIGQFAYPSCNPLPTLTPTVTRTPTMTFTPTMTPTATVTDTPTATPSPTLSPTVTDTATITLTPSPSATASPTATMTSTPPPPSTPTVTETTTPTATATETPTATPMSTDTPTPSETPTLAQTATSLPTLTETPTPSTTPAMPFHVYLPVISNGEPL